ncbi:pyruvate ferredoxin oxidoreductase delta subunit [Natronincola peptidivorans]|uniref:Pyruvate ferredoxin oxidoreductase delta subunit n=1 Tax=Natronincola peptidivorans TaxID=426128 RepID=A0A1I0CDI5_9FIRM|nr:4Fe-4S binding protein [Natronincola peptidivorans]SET17625.1 pyruvate ferredoxin oxidoreductase delta subunit [Natronincola peptidivorans]
MKTKDGVEINEEIKWKDICPGGTVAYPGSADLFKTGDWRSMKPVFKAGECKQCLLCVPVCPDSSIPVKDKKRLDFDFDHCKGCGVCVKVCPFNAIDFIKEGK